MQQSNIHRPVGTSSSASRPRLLVIGAGMAAAYLLQELAGKLRGWEVTVAGEEARACYNRVLLSSVLAGEQSEEQLGMLDDTPESEARRIRFCTQTRITSIDWSQKSAQCANGNELSFDRLVFATGARAALPLLDGVDASGVMVLRTLNDCRALRDSAGSARRAVVVGGGLLGLEAAHGLNRMGCQTTVVHRQAHLMNRQLDAAGGEALRAALAGGGMAFELGASIVSLQREWGAVTGVTLDNGKQWSCDLLVFATGIEANISLAAEAGLAVDRGIQVNEFMQTSRAGVSALGECSQLGTHCFGLVAPVREQAKVLARVLNGEPVSGFVPGHYPTQLKISGVDIYSDGELQGEAEELLLTDSVSGVYRRLRLRNNRLIGAVLVGDKQGGNWYSELIREAADISALRPGLMFGPKICESLTTATAVAV